jgi:hypothetical protein
MKKIIEYLKHPSKIIIFLDNHNLIRLSDEKYLKILFKITNGFDLNLKNPKTFNEKLQWLKLHDHKDIYTTMVDKYAVKKYVGDIIGDEYIIPTLGVYDKWEDIDFEKLPNSFVIKCTHDSGGVAICKDKSTFNFTKAKKKIVSSLNRNFFYLGREWPYKNVKPRIIIEKYMGENLSDFKVLCFNGKPELIELHQNRGRKNYTQDFYDEKWQKKNISQKNDPNSTYKLKQPINFKLMLKFSKILSKNIIHIRVDWYEINGRLYFGELTFYDGGGFVPCNNFDDDIMLGNMINLNLQKKDINK